jgi:hypothetical protein
MLVLPHVKSGISILPIEGGLTFIAVALAFAVPRLGSAAFHFIEQNFGRLARRQHLSVALIGATALLLRLAMLPILPIPYPTNADDFGFLFAADTFAHGRLTNPTPAMWMHFETMHITMKPTYASMFFPANGLILAAGQVLFGHPWYGMLIVTALMCATLCWMLQGWLPPTWALLGGLLAVLRIGVFSYWINTYIGAGPVAALGGSLVLGALPRLKKTLRVRDGVLLAIGIVILANSRPYEGLLLCIPVTLVLGRGLFFQANHPALGQVLRASAAPLLLIVAAAVWMGYFNYRNFNSPLTLPYTIDQATYSVTPHFIWQPQKPEPPYRFKVMRDYYIDLELPEFKELRTVSGFLPGTLLKGVRVFLFFAGFALIPPLIMLRRVILDRRVRFLMICMVPMTVGVVLEGGVRSYYLAPFTAAFYAIGLQAMRHLKQWKPEGRSVGNTMVRFLVTLCVTLGAVDLWAKPLKLEMPNSIASIWTCECLGPPQPGSERANIQAALGRIPGNHLVLVRYAPNHAPGDEWVYNEANIDSSKVIWAREMDSGNNEELLRYYKDRDVWLVQPDKTPATLAPYQGAAGATSKAPTSK